MGTGDFIAGLVGLFAAFALSLPATASDPFLATRDDASGGNGFAFQKAHEAVKTESGRMTLEEAMGAVKGRLGQIDNETEAGQLDLQQLINSGGVSSNGYDASGAIKKLNEIYEASFAEMDVEIIRCSGRVDSEQTKLRQIQAETLEQEAQLEDDQSDLKEVGDARQDVAESFRALKRQLRAHRRECRVQQRETRALIKAIRKDLKIGKKVMDNSECKPSTLMFQSSPFASSFFSVESEGEEMTQQNNRWDLPGSSVEEEDEEEDDEDETGPRGRMQASPPSVSSSPFSEGTGTEEGVGGGGEETSLHSRSASGSRGAREREDPDAVMDRLGLSFLQEEAVVASAKGRREGKKAETGEVRVIDVDGVEDEESESIFPLDEEEEEEEDEEKEKMESQQEGEEEKDLPASHPSLTHSSSLLASLQSLADMPSQISTSSNASLSLPLSTSTHPAVLLASQRVSAQRTDIQQHLDSGHVLVECGALDGTAFMSWQPVALAEELVRLSTQLSPVIDEGGGSGGSMESLLQGGGTEGGEGTPTYGNGLRVGRSARERMRELGSQIAGGLGSGKKSKKAWEKWAKSASAGPCRVVKNPECPSLYEALGDLVSEIEYELHKQEGFLGDHARECDSIESSIRKEIRGLRAQQNRLSSARAAVLARMNKLKVLVRQTQKRQRLQRKAVKAAVEECTDTVDSHKSALCGAIRIKLEIMRMSSIPNEIFDCEVSPWEKDGPCSAECEGGTQLYRRQVVVNPSPTYGAKCPLLKASAVCNDVPCPSDCKVGPWAGWTACSKDCGVGITFRMRRVEQPPRNGGLACPARQETAECSVSQCDRDCELTDWTPFSKCSRACDGGMKLRKKFVKERARGSGFCPEREDSRRLEERECNLMACPSNEFAVCNSDTDLIFVMDSSGSVGSYGWKLQTAAVREMIQAVNLATAQVGIVTFATDAANHLTLTNDQAKVKDKITDASLGARWQGGLTATALALEHAHRMMQDFGRPDAEKVVVVLTDGRPNRSGQRWSIWSAVRHMKRMGRLVFINIGNRWARWSLKRWSSGGKYDYFEVDDFKELEKGASALVTSLCEEVKFVPSKPSGVTSEASWALLQSRQEARKKLVSMSSHADKKEESASSSSASKGPDRSGKNGFPSSWRFGQWLLGGGPLGGRGSISSLFHR